MARIKLDLHDIYNNSKAIDKALQEAFEEAIDKKIKEDYEKNDLIKKTHLSKADLQNVDLPFA